MKAQQRFKNFVEGKPVDRMPVVEWAPWWSLTRKKWFESGLDKNLIDEQDNIKTFCNIQRFFGLDMIYMIEAGPAVPNPDVYGGPVVENESEYDALIERLYPRPFMPQWKIDSIRELMESEEGCIFRLAMDGSFWYPRKLFGIENHFYSFYDQSGLYKRMCQDLAKWNKEVINYYSALFDITFISFAEDMSYNHGSMISKEVFDEFILPYYREIIPYIKEKGLVTFVDSDGDVSEPFVWYRNAGLDGIFPLERQAGTEVSKYIAIDNKMTFMGHFDKLVMHLGEERLLKEFAYLKRASQGGKLIVSTDHQTTPDVSVEQYKQYVRLLKLYAEGKLEV